jgi:hypothetical protein
MQFICDAPGGRTWFRIETEAEASRESEDMRHAVEKFFRREYAAAVQGYRPVSTVFIEQEIGLKDHIRRVMPLFLTLRDPEGMALATAMLPPSGRPDPAFRTILVGRENADPYAAQSDAIAALARHFGIALDRSRCYPYRRD